MYGSLARRNVLTMILAGGMGERLYPLTRDRAKPAVPFGGRYRIIDFVINNFINSGFFKIKVLTQFKSNSLIEHITRTWRLVPEIGQYVDVVPGADAQGAVLVPRHGRRGLPEPRADLRRAAGVRLRLRRRSHLQDGCEPDAAGAPDQRRRPDHRHDSGAGRRGAALRHRRSRQRLARHRLRGEAEGRRAKTIPGRPDMVLASMGNYIFKANVMIDVLQRNALRDAAHDFGKEIIPDDVSADEGATRTTSARTTSPARRRYNRGYWRDVGTIDSYFAASLDLVAVTPLFNLYNPQWPMVSAPLQPAAGEVRLRRLEVAAHRHRHRLARLGRRRSSPAARSTAACSIRACASTPTPTSTSRS